MSTAAEKIREKAERLKRQEAEKNQPSASAGEPKVPAAAPVRAKPIRSTIDLPPSRHNALKMWCAETAVEIGQSRVTTQDVVRAMVGRLLTDETFARKIRADLQAESQ